MPQPVKPNESLGPFDVTILCARPIVPWTNRMTNPIQRPGRPRQRDLAQSQMQQVLVQKCQRLVCLFETAQGIFLALSDMLEKPANLADAQVARMTFAVKQDVAPAPLGIPLPRLRPTEPAQSSRTKLIKQPRGLRSW